MTKNYKFQKLISSIIILSVFIPAFLAFSLPKEAKAQWITHDILVSLFTGQSAASGALQAAQGVKAIAARITQQILMVLAQRLLKQMTKGVVNWVNSGFHGAPLFLESPKSFFTDIAKSEVKTLVDTIGYDNLRNPFGKNYALNVINLYKQQSQDNLQYSLSRVNNDVVYQQNYRNNFNVGGWNGFLLNTQYPQNNPYGYQLVQNDYLAQKLAGTEQTAAGQVKDTLSQGLGFLSPQMCDSNPNYDNTKNAFHQPTFDPSTFYKNHEYPDSGSCVENPTTVAEQVACTAYRTQVAAYQAELASVRAEWDVKNSCPGGLKSTTPGSVVGNSVSKALGASQDQASLAGALGNSISAILDSLLNHFLDKGLNGLASRVNPTPAPDTWNYLGQTLGSPTTDTSGGGWDSGPDEPIVLSDFKNGVQQGIDDTSKEIQLMDNSDATNSGITQTLGLIWEKTETLDACQPGPDLGWEARVDKEATRNGQPLENKLVNQDSSPAKVKGAQVALNELNSAIAFYKDWASNKMLLALPDSAQFLDTIKGITAIQREYDQLVDNKRTKVNALLRLKSIQAGLNAITIQPATGSSQETVMITLKKQYDAVRDSISNPITVESTKSELNTAQDILKNTSKQVEQCTAERATAGWSPVTVTNGLSSGARSTLAGAVVMAKDNPIRTGGGGGAFGGGKSTSRFPNNSEESQYCVLPLMGGVSHYPFINPADFPNFSKLYSGGDNSNIPSLSADGSDLDTAYHPYDPLFYSKVQYPEIPIVNTPFEIYNESGGFLGIGGDDFESNVDCELVYDSSILDYKGNIPGFSGGFVGSGNTGSTPVDTTSGITTTVGTVTTATSPTETTPGWLGDLDFDTKDNVWLVVSNGGTMSGRLTDANGKTIGDVFRITPADQDGAYTPLVSYSPDANKFLVVWNSFANPSGPNGFYGRFVSGDGTMGNTFALNADGFMNLGALKTSSLKYDGRNKKFVFAWMPFSGNGALTTIDLNGGVGGTVALASSGKGNWNPKIAINESKNEYCVVYDQRSGGAGNTTPSLAVRPINAANLSAGVETSTTIGTTSADIAYNKTSGKYMVVYNNSQGGTSGKILSSCNLTNGAGPEISVLAGERVVRIAANPTSNTFGVIGQDQQDLASGYEALNGGTGAVLPETIGKIMTNPRNGQYVQMIAPNLNNGTYGAVTDYDYAATVLVTGIGLKTQ